MVHRAVLLAAVAASVLSAYAVLSVIGLAVAADTVDADGYHLLSLNQTNTWHSVAANEGRTWGLSRKPRAPI